MKYKLTNHKIVYRGVTLYQIEAVSKFGCLDIGDRGGYIQSEKNLSQVGNAWVYDDAIVYGNAQVYGDAIVSGDAKVYGNAQVYGNACVFNNAIVYGNACVSGYAQIYGDAKVYDDAIVSGYAQISGYAQVYGNAQVYGDAIVSGDAKVYGNAQVYGDAIVSGDAQISFEQRVLTGFINKSLKDKKYSLAAQLGIIPNKEGKILLYKKVNKKGGKYFSGYDSGFEYKIGKIAKVKNYDKSNKSCSEGIHLSTPLYWDNYGVNSNCILECEVNLKDIITIQEGKVRCSKCKVIREVRI